LATGFEKAYREADLFVSFDLLFSVESHQKPKQTGLEHVEPAVEIGVFFPLIPSVLYSSFLVLFYKNTLI
jgi:hypothetical protein